MGSVKNVAIKTLGNEMIELHKEKFGLDFDKNKKALQAIKPIASTKVRNTIAGYITHRMKAMSKNSNLFSLVK